MTSKRKKLKIIGAATAGVMVFGVLALLVLPWKVAVGNRLTGMLEDKGFAGVRLTLADVGLRKARLQDISVGEDSPLILKTLDLDYNLRDLFRGDLREVTLQGLALEAVKRNDRWVVMGLDNLQGATDASKSFELPVSRSDFSFLPFSVINVADSVVHIATESWEVNLPVTAMLDKTADPKFTYEAEHINGKAGSITVATGKAEIKGRVDAAAQAWQGTWTIADIALTGQSVEIPVLQGAGTVVAKAGQILVDGTLSSADKTYSMSFVLDDGAPSAFTIKTAQMPWQGGRIALKNEKILLEKPMPLRLDLLVSKIDVNKLMQALTGKKVSATGQFSGTIPVVIDRNGSLSFPEGGLNTEGPGTITMPPDAIPGEGAQLDLVRDIMKNFQYAKFRLGINGIDGKGLSVLLALEGNNPEVENGRLVKLNVSLKGDLLDFIRQNAMLFNDPKALLKQSNDDKN
ncbi:MAG: hypothetical protein JWO78_1577 [Micavibrio sp.]|nr:hypothetical protein [Micavibrio sp.]